MRLKVLCKVSGVVVPLIALCFPMEVSAQNYTPGVFDFLERVDSTARTASIANRYRKQLDSLHQEQESFLLKALDESCKDYSGTGNLEVGQYDESEGVEQVREGVGIWRALDVDCSVRIPTAPSQNPPGMCGDGRVFVSLNRNDLRNVRYSTDEEIAGNPAIFGTYANARELSLHTVHADWSNQRDFRNDTGHPQLPLFNLLAGQSPMLPDTLRFQGTDYNLSKMPRIASWACHNQGGIMEELSHASFFLPKTRAGLFAYPPETPERGDEESAAYLKENFVPTEAFAFTCCRPENWQREQQRPEHRPDTRENYRPEVPQ